MPRVAEPFFHPLAAQAMQDRIASNLFGNDASPIKIGRFVVESMLGSGGMGVVLRCRDPQLGRLVAVKILNTEQVSSDDVAQLLGEARALAALAHPNIVTIHEMGEHLGAPFVVMECIDGKSLACWQTEGPRPLAERLSACRQMVEGLDNAHRIGIIHRDLKPANVVMGNDHRLRVVDFGLARSRPAVLEIGSEDSSEGTTTIGGTRAYMAPEQRRGEAPDTRSDQFSLCLVMYQTVFGALPFDLETLGRFARLDGSLPPRPRRGPWSGPLALRRALTRGLMADPKQRWPDLEGLRHALAPKTWTPRVLVVGVATAVATSLLARAAGDTPCEDATKPIAEVWNKGRRETLLAQALKPDSAFAATALTTTASALDDHAAAWMEVADQSCRAARVDGRASLEWIASVDACLERDMRRVDAVVDALVSGDVAPLAATDSMLRALGSPDSCVTSPEPDAMADPAARTRALAEVAVAAGLLDQADELIEQALAEAAGPDHGASRAATLAVRSASRRALGRFEDAKVDLLASVKLAESTRADVLAATDWCALVRLAAIDLERPDLATTWLDRSEAAVARIGAPADAQGCHELARGHASWSTGDHHNAVAAYRRGLELWTSDPRQSARNRSEATRALGNALADAGQPAAAIELYETLLDQQVGRLGLAHPDVADLEFDLAFALAAVERLNDAIARAEHASEVYATVFGPTSSRHAAAMTRLSGLELAQGDVERAVEFAARAVAIERGSGRRSDLAGALAGLGNALLAAGDLERALEVKLELAVVLPDSAERSRAQVEIDIGELLCLLDRCESAATHYEWAFAHFSPDDALKLYAINGLAKVDLARGEPRVARERLRHVLSQSAAFLADSHTELRAEAQWQLARAILAADEPGDDARGLIADARTFYAANGRDEVVDALDELARLSAAPKGGAAASSGGVVSAGASGDRARSR